MKRPWHQMRPVLLTQVRQDVEQFCPTLHVFAERDGVTIRGTFPVRHDGQELDRYAIRIAFPDVYPEQLPMVREVGGRIPWDGDHHVFVDGVCCVLLNEDRWWSFPLGARFRDYLTGPLHNYLLGQSIVAAGGEWPFGAHEHGALGIIDFYTEKFGTADPKLVVRFLRQLGEGTVRGHLPCPCDSGRPIRHCHPGLVEVARRMPSWAAKESFGRLGKLLDSAKVDASPKAGEVGGPAAQDI